MSFYIGKVPYQIPIWGRHNVYNALAAIAVARQLNVPTPWIQKGLRSFPAPRMRLQRIKGIKNWLLINDCYNANPSAMIAGLKVLMRVAEKKHSVAVLGDMHSLGKLSLESHRKVGKFVAQIKSLGPNHRRTPSNRNRKGSFFSRIQREDPLLAQSTGKSGKLSP